MTQDDSRLRGLTALARKMPHAESSRRDVASFERFEDRLLSRRFKQHGRRVTFARAAFGSALVVLCLGAWWLRPQLGGQPGPAPVLRYAVQASQVEDGPQRLAFSDGSHVVLAKEADAQVAELTPHGARVRLARGHAEVSIARRKHAAWQFQAGPYTVRVTGTAFKLSWSEEQQQIEVGMHHGSVVVTGPLAPAGVALRAGQHLVACDRTRRLLVEDWRKVSTTQLASAESTRGSRAQGRARAKAVAKVEAPAIGSGHDWAKRVAQGDFEGVLREAAQLGERRVLASAGGSDLTALADAARYAGKPKLGRAALLALRERHPEAEMARDSAFFLGRLGHGEDALAWYDRYLREQPEGTYVAQALGRSMMLRYEQGDAPRAAELANRYLARFPGGPYATSARRLSEGARVLPPPP
ncbi:MAG TPA: FecR domain-containing protein [Polyangiales bacterium]